jgi:biopolymer transport protein ExbD
MVGFFFMYIGKSSRRIKRKSYQRLTDQQKNIYDNITYTLDVILTILIFLMCFIFWLYSSYVTFMIK